MQDKIIQSERLAMQVSINSIIVNLILSVGKLAAGILANSAAMISDAIHSASDVFSTFIVMAASRYPIKLLMQNINTDTNVWNVSPPSF